MDESTDSRTMNISNPMMPSARVSRGQRARSSRSPPITQDDRPLLYGGLQQPDAGSLTGSAHHPHNQSLTSNSVVSPSAPAALDSHPQSQQEQQQLQQLQHTSIVVESGSSVHHTKDTGSPIVSYCWLKVLGCFVCWCVNCVFGLAAWILAMVADRSKYTDNEKARRLGNASLGVSISGIIVSIIIAAIVIGLIFGPDRRTDSTTRLGAVSHSQSSYTPCKFNYDGNCYANRRGVVDTCTLPYTKTFANCCNLMELAYHDDYCYSN